jgi:hypothetical protein
MSLEKKTLKIEETMQIQQSKPFAPQLFHDNKTPRHLNMSALSL